MPMRPGKQGIDEEPEVVFTVNHRKRIRSVFESSEDLHVRPVERFYGALEKLHAGIQIANGVMQHDRIRFITRQKIAGDGGRKPR